MQELRPNPLYGPRRLSESALKLVVHVDGGSRGNPGPAGAGVTISSDDGALVHEAAHFLGSQTNNAAEYLALIRALQRVEKCDVQFVTVCSDSELLVKQITGEYRVKSPTLARLYEQVQFLLLKMPRWAIRHVKREQNKRADELANLAMDRRCDVLVFDADPNQAAAATPAKTPPEADQSTEAEPAGVLQALGGGAQAALVSLAPDSDLNRCPAGQWLETPLTVERALPAGFCIHAAHALAPTILAILNTDPAEFAAVPTLTVRCTNPDCRATFHVSPTRPTNGDADHGS